VLLFRPKNISKNFLEDGDHMRVQYAATIAFCMVATCAGFLSTADRLHAENAVVGMIDNTKQNNPSSRAPAAVAATCEAAWVTADLNENGVLDPDEASVYAAALNSDTPAVTDTNLNRTGFLTECEAQTAHE
jgi:hypothetical protein